MSKALNPVKIHSMVPKKLAKCSHLSFLVPVSLNSYRVRARNRMTSDAQSGNENENESVPLLPAVGLEQPCPTDSAEKRKREKVSVVARQRSSS